MSILIPLEAASDRDRHGAKAANLSFLVLKRMNVPEGRVLPVDAFARQVATCDPAANLADELASRPLSGELAAELRAIVTTLGGRVAVRSSATLEDGKTHSFAGQFLTVLNVGADGVEAAVRAVWASAFSDNVRAYLHRGDLDPRKLQMAVVLQRQLDSESSGVVMGRPGGVSVEAVWGQGEALVSGAVSADRWEVEGGRITNTRIATKYARVAVAAGAPTGSLSRIELRDSERTRPSLTTNQVLEVAATCERLAEACEGRPQDCEFAYVSGKLHLLQTRDVTASLPVSAPPLGDFSPPGKGAWELNTSHFQRPCTAMFRSIFPENMAAGFKTGTERYGSLLSHVEFAFVKGFAYTRARLVAAPEDATAKPPPPAWLFRLLCTLVPALRKRLRTAKRIWTSQEWRRQLDEWQVAKASSIEEHLRLQSVPVDALDDAQLAEHFDRVCAHAGRMVQQHHSYNVAALLQMGDLICHAANWSQGQVSVADVVAVLRGASPISADLNSDEAREVGAALAACQVARQLLRLQPGDAAIADDAAERALEMLRALPGDVGDKMRRFLAMREFRLVEGIDPGVPCLRECPSLLWHALRSTALAVDTQVKSPPEQGDADALARLRAAVPSDKHDELDALVSEARKMASLRDERALFSDVWAWGILRTTVLAIGRRLIRRSSELLSAQSDLVQATPDEVLSLLLHSDGPSASELETRAAYFRAYTTNDAPSTLGPRALAPSFDMLPNEAARVMSALFSVIAQIIPPAAEPSGAGMRGVPASSGAWEGPAHIVSSHDDARDIPAGAVLVVGSASSSFTMLAPLASAVVSEGGGLLSHVAIVCREYRIPCVCGVAGVLASVQRGQRLRVDGTRGVVEAVAPA